MQSRKTTHFAGEAFRSKPDIRFPQEQEAREDHSPESRHEKIVALCPAICRWELAHFQETKNHLAYQIVHEIGESCAALAGKCGR